MRTVIGKTSIEMGIAEFQALCEPHDAVLVDIGCGDGSFPYRVAGDHGALLCVGLDANAEAMAKYAARARRKSARGGRGNVLFVASAIESLPLELKGIAGLLTVNFPWSGLLASVARGEPTLVQAIDHLAAADCTLQILVNADADVPDLDTFTPQGLADVLGSALPRARFELRSAGWLPADARVRSQWGGRLIKGSGRRTIHVVAQRGSPDAPLSNVLAQAIGLPVSPNS